MGFRWCGVLHAKERTRFELLSVENATRLGWSWMAGESQEGWISDIRNS
jgi:hypothetical protein